MFLRGCQAAVKQARFLLRRASHLSHSHTTTNTVDYNGLADISLPVQVQSGGSFDVDYEVVGPQERVIMKGEKDKQGDFVFTANDVGEYRFCFNNEMSTWAEKLVDFEIAVCLPSNPFRPSLNDAVRALEPQKTDKLPSGRSKTNPAPSCPQNKAPPPNKPPCSKNPS